jgi:signal transduction histidine kinase
MFSYVACLSIAVFILLGLLFASYSYRYFSEADRSVAAEMARLLDVYRNAGSAALGREIAAAKPAADGARFDYLLVDARRQRLGGTLPGWPALGYSRWLQLEYAVLFERWNTLGGELIMRRQPLAGGQELVVARNYSDMILIERVIGSVLVRSMIVTIVLGAIGGAVVAARSVRHVDIVNRAVNTLMSGDLSKRIPENNAGGDFSALVVNFNRMLDRIQALMEGMRQVSDNIAHDLRTPLTRLRNNLAELQSSVGAANQDTVQALLDEADNLLATFSALLRIAQVESGHRSSGFTEVDLQVILRDVVDLYEPLAADKQIGIDVELPAPLPLSGDRDLLFQAFANVLDNAIKYTPEGGSIRVRAAVEDACACVDISDSGMGIPAADCGTVFRRLYRVEASRGEQPGNGLGLSLVQAVVNLHRGNIALADNRPGLQFRVRLPGAAA